MCIFHAVFCDDGHISAGVCVYFRVNDASFHPAILTQFISFFRQIAARVKKRFGAKKEREREGKKNNWSPPTHQPPSSATDLIKTGLVKRPGEKICCLHKKTYCILYIHV